MLACRVFRFAPSLAIAVTLLLLQSMVAYAEPVRVLEGGAKSADVRLAPPKDLDGYFPFTPSKSPELWQPRAEELKRRVLVSQGLWPMPQGADLKLSIHGLVDMGDYTIEKVSFESIAGLYVTGSLYRPTKATGQRPGILCPHGHWNEGRFHDAGRQNTRREIVKGAERFEEGGRSPLQSRCVQLARMGCVVFHYDMLGYADSRQLSFELVHRFAKQRPEMNHPTEWGLYSPQAESNLQSVMGLQTYHSMRALDFLVSLPDVDPARLGVTGASGGATQTFLLAAVDPRIAAAFPAVMVSTAMQGGCTCENSSLLRVGTGNVELAALFAPKPLGLTSADDWTREFHQKGMPDLAAHYAMMGAPSNVQLTALTHFGHNYNYVSRAAMYSFFNKHFKLGLEEPIVEEDYKFQTAAELTVWDAEHPLPESGDSFERKLCRALAADTRKQLDALRPNSADMLEKYRDVVGDGVSVVIGRSLPAASSLEYDQKIKTDRGDYIEMHGLVKHKPAGEEIPASFLYPKEWSGSVVLWIDPAGKSSILDATGAPTAPVKKLMAAGHAVASADLLDQGEQRLGDASQNRVVANPREFAGYTYGYNPSLFAQRVHDVLTMVAFIRSHEREPKSLAIIAGEGAGPWALAARSQAPTAINLLAASSGGFRFASVADYRHEHFLPGGAKYDDLPGMIALSAPAKLWLAGESEAAVSLASNAYAAAGDRAALTLATRPEDGTVDKAVAYILGQLPAK